MSGFGMGGGRFVMSGRGFCRIYEGVRDGGQEIQFERIEIMSERKEVRVRR